MPDIVKRPDAIRNLAGAFPYVNGSWLRDETVFQAGVLEDKNPSTGETIALVPLATPEVADLAMEGAYRAWHQWRRTTTRDRAAFLGRLARALENRRDGLVRIIQAETGILHARAHEEVTHGVGLLSDGAKYKDELSVKRMRQDPLPPAKVFQSPYGVVVWIKSWNSPIAALCKIATPLLVGNTVVLKVSPYTPLCASLFAEAVDESGFPPGVVNILWDAHGELGQRLVQNPLLGKCAFTGRGDTARKVLSSISSCRVRPSFIESGGGGVQVVLYDAELDKVLAQIFWGAFTLSGQICCAGTRILVEEPLFERLVGELAGIARSLVVGPAEDPKTQLGPVITESEVVRLQDLLTRGIAAGAEVFSKRGDMPETGAFYPPTVAATEDTQNPLFQEEIFGPIVVVCPVSSREEALLELERLTPGLAVAFYTRNTAWVEAHEPEVIAGNIWVNAYYQSSPRIPFGGMKDSGYGRLNNEAGLREFTQEKAIVA